MIKKIALIAHDNRKTDLLEWVSYNLHVLVQHEPYATGTTGKLLQEELELEITKLDELFHPTAQIVAILAV